MENTKENKKQVSLRLGKQVKGTNVFLRRTSKVRSHKNPF